MAAVDLSAIEAKEPHSGIQAEEREPLLGKRYSASQLWEFAFLAVLVIAIVGFYGAFIRPGVTWADDWATYIQDALNILHGKSYSATGYIFNPDLDIGPTAYPPLYPLTLTLPIAIWGVDFHAIREFQLIFWAAFLIAVYFVARQRLSSVYALLVVGAIGLSPYFFEFKDYIASESLFLALLYITFALVARFEETARNRDHAPGSGIWLGVMIALCIATRSVGLILLPTFAGYDLLRFRRLRKETTIALSIAGASFILQLFLVDFFHDYVATLFLNSRADLQTAGVRPATVGVMERLIGIVSLIVHRPYAFALEISRLWGEGSQGTLLPRIVSVVFCLLAIYGFTKAVRRNVMHCDVFAGLYAATLLALPTIMAGARMQMPLDPLFYIYVLLAATETSVIWARRAGVTAILVLGVGSYLQSYKNLEFYAPLTGLHTSDYADMFAYITSHTELDSTIIFDKPRTLALYTRRRAAAVYQSRTGDALLSYMHEIGARYILFYDLWHEGHPRNEYVSKILGSHVEEFQPIRDSGHFVLYKMKDESGR